MAKALTAARRQRGTVRASIAMFDAQIIWREDKAERSASDYCAIQYDMETLKEYHADFKEYHFAVVELANEEEWQQSRLA